MKINFFSDNLFDAINGGVYEIHLKTNEEDHLLYIGQSVFVLIRCATHLFEFRKNPKYFGFKDDSCFKEPTLELIMKLNKSEPDKSKREQEELRLIKLHQPKLQSGIKDRMKNIEEKIEVIAEILNN